MVSEIEDVDDSEADSSSGEARGRRGPDGAERVRDRVHRAKTENLELHVVDDVGDELVVEVENHDSDGSIYTTSPSDLYCGCWDSRSRDVVCKHLIYLALQTDHESVAEVTREAIGESEWGEYPGGITILSECPPLGVQSPEEMLDDILSGRSREQEPYPQNANLDSEPVERESGSTERESGFFSRLFQ